MSYLYLDTSEYLIVGVCDSDYRWLDYQMLKEKKSASKIHQLINGVLQKLKLEFSQLEAVFHAAGPGSYTGIRLSEGITQILELEKYQIYSFYHFEIPKLLGEASGSWVSTAFRDEFFVYSWFGDEKTSKLLGRSDFINFVNNNEHKIYGHGDSPAISELNLNKDIDETSKLIEKQADQIFPQVAKLKLRREPFYYRQLEQEFLPSLKD